MLKARQGGGIPTPTPNPSTEYGPGCQRPQACRADLLHSKPSTEHQPPRRRAIKKGWPAFSCSTVSAGSVRAPRRSCPILATRAGYYLDGTPPSVFRVADPPSRRREPHVLKSDVVLLTCPLTENLKPLVDDCLKLRWGGVGAGSAKRGRRFPYGFY